MSTSEYVSPSRNAAPAPLPPAAVGRKHNDPALAAAALMMLNDVLVSVAAFSVALLLHFYVLSRLSYFRDLPINVTPRFSDIGYLVWFLLTLLFVLRRYGLYNGVPARSGAHEQRLIVQACFTAGLLLCGGLYMANNQNLSRLVVIVLIGTTAVALGIRRALWRMVRFAHYAKGVETRNVVILGTNQLCHAMGQHIADDYHLGYQLCGFINAPGCDGRADVPEEKILGGIDRLRELTRLHFIDELVIAEPCSIETLAELVEESHDLGIDLRALSGFYGGHLPRRHTPSPQSTNHCILPQACGRHHPLVERADRSISAHAADCRSRVARLTGTDFLRLREDRQTGARVSVLQVPHHGQGCGAEEAGADGAQRARWDPLQDDG